jgi:TPR repeat protein
VASPGGYPGTGLFAVKVAMMYDMGLGVPKDDQEVFKWVLLAAKPGHPLTQFKGGVDVHYGKRSRQG